MSAQQPTGKLRPSGRGAVTDIVERLRKHVGDRGGTSISNGAWTMMLEAASEIERLRSALAAEQDGREINIATTVSNELERMYEDGVPMTMREGETTWRTYHAGFDLSMFAIRISDAIAAAIRART